MKSTEKGGPGRAQLLQERQKPCLREARAHSHSEDRNRIHPLCLDHRDAVLLGAGATLSPAQDPPKTESRGGGRATERAPQQWWWGKTLQNDERYQTPDPRNAENTWRDKQPQTPQWLNVWPKTGPLPSSGLHGPASPALPHPSWPPPMRGCRNRFQEASFECCNLPTPGLGVKGLYLMQLE